MSTEYEDTPREPLPEELIEAALNAVDAMDVSGRPRLSLWASDVAVVLDAALAFRDAEGRPVLVRVRGGENSKVGEYAADVLARELAAAESRVAELTAEREEARFTAATFLVELERTRAALVELRHHSRCDIDSIIAEADAQIAASARALLGGDRV